MSDPAYDLPLPPAWALNEAAKQAGFADWFAVRAAFRTEADRAIIVKGRQIASAGTASGHKQPERAEHQPKDGI